MRLHKSSEALCTVNQHSGSDAIGSELVCLRNWVLSGKQPIAEYDRIAQRANVLWRRRCATETLWVAVRSWSDCWSSGMIKAEPRYVYANLGSNWPHTYPSPHWFSAFCTCSPKKQTLSSKDFKKQCLETQEAVLASKVWWPLFSTLRLRILAKNSPSSCACANFSAKGHYDDIVSACLSVPVCLSVRYSQVKNHCS